MNALTSFFNKLFGSRKAILAFSLLIFYAIGMWLNKIPPQIASDTIKWILLTYISAEGLIDAVRAHKSEIMELGDKNE